MKYGFEQLGASLVDTLMAVAIVGVLVSVGAPAYKNYTTNAKRKNVQKMLLTYSLHQESFRLTHFRYASVEELPIFTHVDYNIEVNKLTDQTFQAVAIIKDKNNKQCSVFSINQRLERVPIGCW